MALGTAVSRVSGLLAKVPLVAVLGLGVVNDSYTVANTLPTVVNELWAVLIASRFRDWYAPENAESTRARRTPSGWRPRRSCWRQDRVTVLAVPLPRSPLWVRHARERRTPRRSPTCCCPIICYGSRHCCRRSECAALASRRAPVVNNVAVIATVICYADAGRDLDRPGPDGRAEAAGAGREPPARAEPGDGGFLRRSGFRFRWRWANRRLSEFALPSGPDVHRVSQVGMVASRGCAGRAVPGAWRPSTTPAAVPSPLRRARCFPADRADAQDQRGGEPGMAVRPDLGWGAPHRDPGYAGERCMIVAGSSIVAFFPSVPAVAGVGMTLAALAIDRPTDHHAAVARVLRDARFAHSHRSPW